MRRRLLALLVACSPLLLSTPAAACSAGPFDLRATTRVVVLGRVTDIALVRHDLQPPAVKSSETWYRKLVTMEVTRVYKGAPPATLRFWDAGIARYEGPPGGQVVNWGGGGDCSAITQDVRGRFVGVALGAGENGELSSSILLGSVVLDGPDDPRLSPLLDRHGLRLPGTSTR